MCSLQGRISLYMLILNDTIVISGARICLPVIIILHLARSSIGYSGLTASDSVNGRHIQDKVGIAHSWTVTADGPAS